MDTASRLTKILRRAGTASLIVSAIIFMVQGLSAMNSMERYLSFFALSAGLGALGLFTGTRWREGNSARTFLGLAAAATPVLFSNLGALLYGALGFQASTQLPSLLTVAAPTLAFVGLAMVGTVVVMSPILYVGFAGFFRAHAKQLAMMLIAGSALLLIPVRDTNLSALLILSQSLSFFFITRAWSTEHAGEAESRVALLLPLAPLAIMAGRALFYHPTPFFGSAGFLSLAILAHMFSGLFPRNERDRQNLEALAMVSAAVSWFFLMLGLADLSVLKDAVAVFLGIYPPAMVILVKGHKDFLTLKSIAALAAVASSLQLLGTSWSFVPATALFLVGLASIVFAYTYRSEAGCKIGGVTMAIGIMYFIHLSMDYFRAQPWISLAVAGTAVILLAGWMESHRSKVSEWQARWNSRF